MRIKTYLVNHLGEAIEKIKKELGPQAVILSTRKVEGQGWSQKTCRLEVTATLPDAPPAFREAPVDALLEKETQKNPLPGFSQPKPAPSPLRPFYERGSSWVDALSHLVAHRLSARALEALIAASPDEKISSDPQTCQAWIASWLEKNLPAVTPFSIQANAPSHLAFVGPTGSGKTTTLIKIAHSLLQDLSPSSFAILSLDYERLGRQEPLRRFAQQHGIRFRLIQSDRQLKEAQKAFSNLQTLLIDTEGFSPFDTHRMHHLQQMLSGFEGLYKSLVLPVSMPQNDLQQMIAAFSTLGLDSLTLTKLDETLYFGNLFNASYESGLPLAYFTTGQKIPEDIEISGFERILSCLFHGLDGVVDSSTRPAPNVSNPEVPKKKEETPSFPLVSTAGSPSIPSLSKNFEELPLYSILQQAWKSRQMYVGGS